MKNIALRLSFDGSNYHGWQMQKRDRSVQEMLQKALAAVCGNRVPVTGCGRTDAGVHALRYCANFRSESTIPLDRLPLAVNSRLPSDIAVSAACEVPEDFNAVCSCIKKEYLYRIHNSRIRDPFLQRRVCFYPAPLDRDLLRQAAAAFEGTHDFAAVRSVGTETKTTVRTVFWCRVKAEDEHIEIRICADGFLYNMARAMVGTMVYAGHGKIPPGEIPRAAEETRQASDRPDHAAAGLYMNRIWYEGPAGTMMQAGESE